MFDSNPLTAQMDGLINVESASFISKNHVTHFILAKWNVQKGGEVNCARRKRLEQNRISC